MSAERYRSERIAERFIEEFGGWISIEITTAKIADFIERELFPLTSNAIEQLRAERDAARSGWEHADKHRSDDADSRLGEAAAEECDWLRARLAEVHAERDASVAREVQLREALTKMESKNS